MLLLMVFIAVTIPFITSPQLFQPIIQIKLEPIFQSQTNLDEPVRMAISAEAIQPSVATPETIQTYHISYKSIILYLYFSGVFVSILLLIYSISSVLLLFWKARSIRLDRIHLKIISDDIPAFSFGRNILISEYDYETNSEAILAHEMSHIRLGHFYDLILMETIKIIFWFNPLVYRMIRDLKDIHEFQADDHTLNSGIDATQYQLLIIQKGVGPQRFALANSFNHCQIKNRITMMNKQKTSKAWRWKVATFLPLLALLLMAFGKPGENVPPDRTLLSPLVSSVSKDSVKQWTEADFSKPDVLNNEFPNQTLLGFKIQINSNSKIIAFNKNCSLKELPDLIRIYVDFDFANENTKSGFMKMMVNGKQKMRSINLLMILKDVNTPEIDYQTLLNTIGNTILEIRGKYAKSIFNMSYAKLPLVQQVEINKLIPSVASFIHMPIIATEINKGKQTLTIEIRLEGIIVAPSEKTCSMEELRKKVESFIIENPNGFVDLKVEEHVIVGVVTEVKELLHKSNALAVNYSSFDPVYTIVEEMPDFPGGNEGLREWISKNIKYPEVAKSKGIEGKVFVKFVVDDKGKVKNAKIVKSINSELDAEALRVVSQQPVWTPGKQRGVPVCVAYTMPVNFSTK
ncbi:MAG: M56 family metallopeptidase [Prolixibacteraceae bacterium]